MSSVYHTREFMVMEALLEHCARINTGTVLHGKACIGPKIDVLVKYAQPSAVFDTLVDATSNRRWDRLVHIRPAAMLTADRVANRIDGDIALNLLGAVRLTEAQMRLDLANQSAEMSKALDAMLYDVRLAILDDVNLATTECPNGLVTDLEISAATFPADVAADIGIFLLTITATADNVM